MIGRILGYLVFGTVLVLLWPVAAYAQEDSPASSAPVTTTVTQTVTSQSLRIEYAFSPPVRRAPDLYPDPALSAPTLGGSDDTYMQGWYPHPRYVNGSCAWVAQPGGDGMLISTDAICLSPSNRALFRSVSLTAIDRTGRPLGGTLMTYRNNVSVGVYPITKSPFTLTVDVNESFDRIGIYFRRPTVFDDVAIWN